MNGFPWPAAALAAALATTTPGGPAPPADALSLPHSKVNLDACVQAAASRHPGTIQRLRVRHRGEASFFWIAIKERRGREWIVICDGATRQILQEQRLLDIVP